MDGLNNPGLHIKYSRAGGPAIFDCKRAPQECAGRKHRVVMPEYEHLGSTSPAPMDVRTCSALNESWAGSKASFHQGGDGLS